MITYLPDSLNPDLKAPVYSLLRYLLIVHLMIVLFMIPIRSIFYDTSYWRDIILFIMIFILAGVSSISLSKKIKYNILDKLIILYLVLGVIIALMFFIYSGLDIISSIREYRNHFLPFILFFIARLVIRNAQLRIKISNIFFVLMLIFLFGTLFEYILIKIMGVSPGRIPWYAYTFNISDRYIGSLANATGYIQTSDTPILGFLGWPHATAACLMCLVGFNYPFIISKGNRNKTILLASRLPSWFSPVILSLIGFVIIYVLQVKMHSFTFLLLITLFPIFLKQKKIIKTIVGFTFTMIIIFSIEDFRIPLLIQFNEGFVGSEISQSTFYHIINFTFDSVLDNLSFISLLFGDYNLEKYLGGEFRILNYALKFGIFWLIIFTSLFLWSSTRLKKCLRDKHILNTDKLFITGIIYMLLISIIDMGHYARAMTWPIIDLIAISLGSVSPFLNYLDFRNSKINKRLEVL